MVESTINVQRATVILTPTLRRGTVNWSAPEVLQVRRSLIFHIHSRQYIWPNCPIDNARYGQMDQSIPGALAPGRLGLYGGVRRVQLRWGQAMVFRPSFLESSGIL